MQQRLKRKEINSDASGISKDSLDKSRKIRQDFIAQFGCVPTTILRYDHKLEDDISLKNKRDYTHQQVLTQEKYGLKDGNLNQSAFKMRGVSCRIRKSQYEMEDKENETSTQIGALSTFPKNIGRLLVRFYTPEMGVVYDPFAGHNSRMQFTYECGRSYVGVDISHTFMEDNRKIRKLLLDRNSRKLVKSPATITLYEQSSASVSQVPENFADFSITSPPYYNLEFYGNEPEQLGKAKTYDEFLDNIYLNICETLRILKSGAYCAWFINDFRKDGKFFPYHIDSYQMMVQAGFEPVSIYIIDLGQSIQSIFVQSIVQSKMFPKVHEYALLMRKP